MRVLPVGKLRAETLQAVFDKHPTRDPRVVVGPRVGEDAAVIDLGDRYLVATADPITFATDEIGYYAVTVNANDVAVRGAVPRWFGVTLLLPEGQADGALAEALIRRAVDIARADGRNNAAFWLAIQARDNGFTLADSHIVRRYRSLTGSTNKKGEPEQFTFAGAEGTTVYGYVLRPANFDPGRRYPVAFIVHGGPQSSFANTWSYRWNPQVFAGAGYGVVFVDFHGSTGYGQAFTDSISRDWGGKPLEDLRAGLAAAVQVKPWIDGSRACALGGSYGGYMMNWIAGNWPDGFRCLVNHAGLFDHRSMYYTTEELWFPEWDHGGPYFDNPEGHERSNPANFVKAWKTPMLVIHGALDYRVPYAQGLATFTALQRRGIESRFLFFPDENHWILKPANSLQWHDEVLQWLNHYLRN